MAHALTCLPNIGASLIVARGILSWGILSQVNFSLGDFVMGNLSLGDFVIGASVTGDFVMGDFDPVPGLNGCFQRNIKCEVN